MMPFIKFALADVVTSQIASLPLAIPVYVLFTAVMIPMGRQHNCTIWSAPRR